MRKIPSNIAVSKSGNILGKKVVISLLQSCLYRYSQSSSHQDAVESVLGQRFLELSPEFTDLNNTGFYVRKE